ncbi:class I SAM-dependent methyltransferase [Mesorhizobium sp. CAU 1741]|uniref:class I SAM-dependent methyltransferase n=1 Tax=Mesorhizobium sp. CAU 1741 TaxID=3140366 RepID=UPI00325AC208
MQRQHFKALTPVCPSCRTRGLSSPLAVTLVEADDGEDILAGIIGCTVCGAEYPIIDGLPVIVADVRRFVQDNLFYLMARDDLTPAVESLLGDASGPASGLDSLRQHVSSYAWDHWGDFDPLEDRQMPGGAAPGGVARALGEALEMIAGDALPEGPVLDLGCGAGRSVAELAARMDRLVLGIDLSVPLARMARRTVLSGQVDYARRRVGLAYDRRSFGHALDAKGRADIWICDALALPFSERTFALAVGLNVLDCLGDPRAGLGEIGTVLKDDGQALLSVPFDWTGNVTPVEHWIGGHSQRGPLGGNAEPILEMMLADGPMAAGPLRREKPPREIPWHVRLHERSCVHYQAHLVAARRIVGHNGADSEIG